MNPLRFTTVVFSTIAAGLLGITDLPAQDAVTEHPAAEKSPDISGNWVSDSPLDYFVDDDSQQPVNTFRIDRSKDADFDARYLGARATGVALSWVEKSGQFKGTKESAGGKATFVVTPTDDPDVLTCKIQFGTRDHKDKWKRVRNESETPKAKPITKRDEMVLRYDEDPELTPQIQQDTEELLAPYFLYLKRLGFEIEKNQVVLRLQPGMRNAHYYPANRSIVMDPLVVGDQTTMRREFNHHALALALGDDPEKIFLKCPGIESALADYFGCSASDEPIVGSVFAQALGFAQPNAPYLRTMDNQRQFTELQESSGRHDVGEVVSGALWEIRESVGRRVFDRILYKAWVGLPKTDESKGQVVRFATSLLTVVEKEHSDLEEQIRGVFERRGLTLP